jgi:hypothetical protein
VLYFRQIFEASPVEQYSDVTKPQQLDPTGEPMSLDVDLLAHVSGGAQQGPVGGW